MSLEQTIMAHRYRYYVLDDPSISDALYDCLERQAIATLPADSLVHDVGSSLASSYSPEVIELALSM